MKRKPKKNTIDVVLVKTYQRGGYLWLVMRADDGTIYKQKIGWGAPPKRKKRKT